MLPRSKRRFLSWSILAGFAVLALLPSCGFLMDEFFVLQKAPTSLEDAIEQDRVRE